MFKYYSTQRPIVPGSFPKNEDIVKITNFDTKTFCPDIGREAWGYIEYGLALATEEADAYELTPSGMKLYYCVTTAVNDNGKVIAAITSVVEAACKPEDSFKSLARRDVYNDWFESREEAERLVEEAKTA